MKKVKIIFQRKICSVVCRPDDELFFAGAMLNYRQIGYAARVIYLTQGGYGSATIKEAELKKIRIEEAQKANRIFGFLPPIFMDYPDSRLLCTETLVTDIAKTLRRERPELVLTHARDDTQTDHAYAAEAVLAALVPCASQAFDAATPPAQIRDIYYLVYEHRPVFQLRRKPEIFIDIGGHIEKLKKARLVYKSQKPECLDKKGNLRKDIDLFNLVKKAEFYGEACGCRYAEAYTSAIYAGNWSRKTFPVSRLGER
jgi:LmbE family N-acetylglucosaminyl deacetylase